MIETLVCPVTRFALQRFRIRVGLNSLRPGFERRCLARELHGLVAFELPVDGFEIFDEDLPRAPISRHSMGQRQEFGGPVRAEIEVRKLRQRAARDVETVFQYRPRSLNASVLLS